METEHVEPTDKPLLLLDIDGAVCPYKTPPGATVERIWGLSVPIVPENRERLATLIELYRVVWCSDWLENSNLVGEAFGLPPLPYVPIADPPSDLTPSSELPDPTGELGIDPLSATPLIASSQPETNSG